MGLSAKQKREARDARLREEGAAAARAEGKPAAPDPAVKAANEAAFQNPGAVAAASGEVARPQHAGAKVTVACKIGIAYFDLQLSEIVEKDEQSMGGLRRIKEAIRIGPVVRLRGTARPRGTPPEGFPEAPEIVAGAALTHGVDKEFWDKWSKLNRLNPVVANNMVFADEDPNRVRAKARELAGELSGMDPINPKNLKRDPRIPRPSREGVSEIEPGTKPGAGA